MKHKRFEENILVDEAYTNYGKVDKNADGKKSHGIAKHFAETLEYEEKKKWYHQLPEEPSIKNESLTTEEIENYRKEANSALHGDTLAYETKTNKSGSSDHQWAKTLLNKGAIGDRVAAATILIQDNPIYNLTALRNLISNVKPAKKKDGIIIIDAISELLISDLLIPDTKLRTFTQHPLSEVDKMSSGNKQTRRNILKLWYYEDQLKELYGTYVDALNKFAHDIVDANKEKAVTAMSYLLMHHPEREKALLTNIINKLGDPSQAVASKVIYHLCQLLYNHPNMKSVVLAEIEKMLFRSNISPRAQYYGICFLNQFYLGKDDSKIAEDLIRIYFSFFKASIKKGEVDSRLMSAVLTGVKRAHPCARLSAAAAHVDAIYKLVHLTTLNVAVHALALLLHVVDTSNADRYYTALYRKLTNPDIFSTTHSALLFSLIYKSLKQDTNTDRVCAFIKRLLQLCCYMTPAQSCGILFLISQVLKDGAKKNAVKLVWTKKEVKEEEVKEESPQVTEENGDIPLENAEEKKEDEIKEDQENIDREDKEKKIDLLKGDKRDLLIDDDEETYVDLKIDEQGNIKPKKRKSNATTGWFHAKVKVEEKNEEEKELEVKIQLKKTVNMDKVATEYNPLARNPSYAGANCSAYVELLPLVKHFHPTVKLFAQKLVNDQIIQYSGDPLKDFACIRFLDRFVFKNPKKRVENNPEREDGPKKVKGSHPKFAARKNYTAKGLKSIPVNSSSYLNEDSTRIPVDELFLYDFLRKRREVKGDDDDDSDDDSVTSEDFEKYLDSVTGTKNLDDDEETYVDLKIDEQGNIKPKKRKSNATTGWFHAKVKVEEKNEEEKELEVKIQLKKTVNMDKVATEYNPLARNPSYAGANCSAYVELLPLVKHFHPTVKLFAQKLVNDQIIQYSGDPLKDFACIRFLDRFVFKNPKKRVENNPEREDGPKKVKGSHPKFAARKNYTAKGLKSIPVNSSSYLNEDSTRIPVDELFLYDFLRKRREVKGDDDDDSDDDSVTSEDFEKYLDSVTGTKNLEDADEELDFLADINVASKNKKKKGQDDDDVIGDDGDDDEIGDGDSDDELNISGDDDEPALSGDEDELLLEGSDDDFGVPSKKSKKNKLNLKGKDDLGSLFASAEEFSTLLEETASNKKQGSSQAVSNTDNSSTKQLAWEENRDKWIKGYNKKILGNKGKRKGFDRKGGKNFKMAERGAKRNGGKQDGSGGNRKKIK